MHLSAVEIPEVDASLRPIIGSDSNFLTVGAPSHDGDLGMGWEVIGDKVDRGPVGIHVISHLVRTGGTRNGPNAG